MLWCLMQWSAALRRANSGNELWPCSKRCPWRKWLGAAQAAWKVSLAAVGVPKKDGTLFPGHLWGKGMKKKHGPYPFKTWTKTTLLKRFAARQLNHASWIMPAESGGVSGISGLGTEVRPSQVSFNSIISAFEKGNQWQLATCRCRWALAMAGNTRNLQDLRWYSLLSLRLRVLLPHYSWEAWDFI